MIAPVFWSPVILSGLVSLSFWDWGLTKNWAALECLSKVALLFHKLLSDTDYKIVYLYHLPIQYSNFLLNVINGQSSLRNGAIGNPSWLIRFASGLSDQA